MRTLAFFALAALAVAQNDLDLAVTQEMVDHINSLDTTWTAGIADHFQGMTIGRAKRRCGTIRSGPAKEAARAKMGKWDLTPLPAAAIPTAYDVTQAYPWCPFTIEDQSDCGSCWAFGSTESLTDRFCINYNSTFMISAEEITSCCTNNKGGCATSQGCNGGFPEEALGFAVKLGIVTGGLFQNSSTGTDGCQPYSLPPCSHHEAGIYPMCPTNEYSTPKCSAAACTDPKYPTAFKNDTQMAKTAYNLPSSVSAIQTEIQARGSVVATFDVYSDFLTYTSGVYTHTTGTLLGGHAVKIVGWGVWTDGVTPYWRIANSWNSGWGNQGYFLIIRGKDECGIESDISAATV